MIRFSLLRVGKLDISRPTLMEIAGLAMVLVFFLVLLLFWR
jgi:hypothetical protein